MGVAVLHGVWKNDTPILENANTLEKQYFQRFNYQNIDFQKKYDHFSEIGVQKIQTLYYQQNKLKTVLSHNIKHLPGSTNKFTDMHTHKHYGTC